MSFWSTVSKRRLSRRTALRATAVGAGVVALGLAGCGSSANNTGSAAKTAASSLTTTPVDTTTKATKGGNYQAYLANDVPTFDAIASNNGISFGESMYAYSRILKFKPGRYPAQPDGSIEADAAQSWEVVPGGLRYTFKVRPNMKYDPRPPTNGRPMTSADIKFTWERFGALNQGRTDLVNALNKDAPVTAVSTPDDSTVVFDLAFPYAPFLTMLPYYRYMPIMPVETEGGFNAKGEMRGTGAWRMLNYIPSSRIEYIRNPDWYDAANVYLDGITKFIITEYATGLSQFRAGNIWTFPVASEDILSTKRDIPQLPLLIDTGFSRAISPYLAFSVLPNSPFLDDRVRQAVSMLIDRDLWIDTIYNVSGLKKEGIDVSTRWSSAYSSGEPTWLDPKGNELGDGAKFFQNNVSEAKKLIAAAGRSLPIEMQFGYTPNGYGAVYLREAQIFQAMLQQDGVFKFNIKTPDYATDWVPNYHQGNGKYDGMIMGAISALPEIDGTLFANFHSGNIKSWWGQKDNQLDTMIESQRRELDKDKRTQLLKDIQRYMAAKMYCMITPGAALGFTGANGNNIAWPWLGNFGVFAAYDNDASAAQETITHYWYDASKKAA